MRLEVTDKGLATGVYLLFDRTYQHICDDRVLRYLEAHDLQPVQAYDMEEDGRRYRVLRYDRGNLEAHLPSLRNLAQAVSSESGISSGNGHQTG